MTYTISCVRRLRRAASLALAITLLGSAAPKPITTRVWRAFWIDVPGIAPQGYGVYHFRRTFTLDNQPTRFVVHVSGDNRFQLFVNGKRVASGPARGDLTHWRYQTLDIASALRVGPNTLAAVVWNEGEHRAIAQVSNQTAFVLDADDGANAVVNTNSSWKCSVDPSYAPSVVPADRSNGYFALGPNESVDAHKYPWGWEQPGFDDSAWTPAHQLSHAADRDSRDAPNRWMMVESGIPPEEQRPEEPLTLRQQTGTDGTLVPAHSTAVLLFDQKHLTTAYPELTLSNGADARVTLRYAETLFETDPNSKRLLKGNRDVVEGRRMFGPADVYVADGGDHRRYRPLYWRTYRYLQLEIETQDQPLKIDNLVSVFNAYPFVERAAISTPSTSADADIQKLMTTGWRTARLCAHETYMDCPFYEQLQYGGDARIQMLISLYMSGDSRLMNNGIALLNSSRTAEGATYSRAPSALQQYIPPFSLWWIGMVHDYWMYVQDEDFVREMLPGVESVLRFYASYQKDNGSLVHMPWWNFVDWVKEWPNGEAPSDPDGGSSAALDLQLVLAYQWAADLERALGDPALSTRYGAAAAQLSHTVRITDWDSARGLFADQPTHRTYSQHVNTLAVLAHVSQGPEARAIVEKVFSEQGLAQASIYFRAYTNAALREVGLGDRYLDVLQPWHEMLASGLTTWAEWNGPDVRSDCHAWGASPNFELFRTVAGIEPASPGFRRVRIAPNLGALPAIHARMPHPQGEIAVDFSVAAGALSGTVSLPPGVSGVLVWHGHERQLHAGANRVAAGS